MKRFVYFFICALMTVSVAAQNLNLSSNFRIDGANLNQIQNGDFVYEVEGIGQFVLSMDQDISYEYSRPSIWGTKRHKLVLRTGQGSVTATSFDPSKKIQINSVILSGYAYGSFDVSTVKVGEVSTTWLTDGFDVSAYVTAAEGLKCWDACPVSVSGKNVSLLSLQINYTVYDCISSCTISDQENGTVPSYVYAEEIQLDRKLSAGWNTLCLPFDCNVSELGEGVVAQQFVAYDPNTGLDFAIVDQLEANKPYMVYCPTEIPAMTLTFTGREIYAATPQPVSFNGMTFIGNYEPGFSMYGKYGVAQNKLIKGGANATVNGTRAYFEYAEPETQAVFRINYQQESGTTGIENLQVAPQKKQGVYTLQGVCVRKDDSLKGLPAGVYIQNGKKVLVK